MKKLILGLSILTLSLAGIFVACKKSLNDNTNSSVNKPLNSSRIVNGTNIYNSKWTQKVGVKSITYISTTNGVENFQLNAIEKNINGYSVNLNAANFSVKVVDSIITLKLAISGSPIIEYTMNKNSKVVIDNSSSQIVNDEYLLNDHNNTKFGLALSLYDATFNPNPDLPAALPPGGGSGCDRTIMSFRKSRSFAEMRCSSAASAFCAAHPDCTTVAGVDSGCLWEDYCCVATQEIHCTGAGCSVGYGRF